MPLTTSKEGPLEKRAITREAVLSRRGRQELLDAPAGFFGEVAAGLVRIPLDVAGVLPRLPVNVQEVLAEAPAKAAHAQMHPKPHATPEGQFVIERFGNELRDVSAIQHDLCRFLLPAAFHAICQSQAGSMEKHP